MSQVKLKTVNEVKGGTRRTDWFKESNRNFEKERDKITLISNVIKWNVFEISEKSQSIDSCLPCWCSVRFQAGKYCIKRLKLLSERQRLSIEERNGTICQTLICALQKSRYSKKPQLAWQSTPSYERSNQKPVSFSFNEPHLSCIDRFSRINQGYEGLKGFTWFCLHYLWLPTCSVNHESIYEPHHAIWNKNDAFSLVDTRSTMQVGHTLTH